MRIITIEEIKSDIREYDARIQQAESKLAELPAGRLPYLEHKKREVTKRILESDIQHIKQLIGYAQEALITDTI